MDGVRRQGVVEVITGPVTVIQGTGNLASGITDQAQACVEEAYIQKLVTNLASSQFYQQNNVNYCPPPIIPQYSGGVSSGALLSKQIQQCQVSDLQLNLTAYKQKQIPGCLQMAQKMSGGSSQNFVNSPVNWPPVRFQQYQTYVPPPPPPPIIYNAGQPIASMGPCTNVIGVDTTTPLRPNGTILTPEQYSAYINSIDQSQSNNPRYCLNLNNNN
jgi:hypothetical protein